MRKSVYNNVNFSINCAINGDVIVVDGIGDIVPKRVAINDGV